MDIALMNIFALIIGGALVHFHYQIEDLEQSNKELSELLASLNDDVEHLNSAIVKSEPHERITLLEQKVAAIQMKR